MKRVIHIEANDMESKISIRATFNCKKWLAKSEQQQVVKQLKRSLAGAIKGIIYTDFGIENTKVK